MIRPGVRSSRAGEWPSRHGKATRGSSTLGKWALWTRDAIVDLVFPPVCHVCQRDLHDTREPHLICAACRSEMQAAHAMCPRCAMRLPASYGEQATVGTECPHCRGQKLAFGGVRAVGFYSGRLQEVVLRMKKAAQEPLTLAMGGLLAEHVRDLQAVTPTMVEEGSSGGPRGHHRSPAALAPVADLIVPVPMHWSRRWSRGVNQAGLLAESVARLLNVPCHHRVLVCRRRVRKQGTLGPAERRRNVRGAFGVAVGYAIQGQRLLLVDDVLTTGATANEAARVLRQAGAASVEVAVVARATGE